MTKLSPFPRDYLTNLRALIGWAQEVIDGVGNLRTHTTTEVRLDKARFRKQIAITKGFLEGTTTIAHGITGLSAVHSAFGMVQTSTPEWFSLPWGDAVERSGFKIDGTNVESVIIGTPTWTLFASGFIEIEYSK